MTFNVTVAPTGAVFENAESPETADVNGVDEVSSDCYYLNIADFMFQIHRLLEFVLQCLINDHQSFKLPIALSNTRSSLR